MKPRAFHAPMRLIPAKLAGYNHGWFWDEVYCADVDLIWPANAQKISAFVKKRCDFDYETKDDFQARTLEVPKPDGSVANIICLQCWYPSPKWHAVLAHEALHCAEQILARCGIPAIRETSEAYAYLLESIVRRCLILLGEVSLP